MNKVYFITNLYLSNDMYQDTIRIFIFIYFSIRIIKREINISVSRFRFISLFVTSFISVKNKLESK